MTADIAAAKAGPGHQINGRHQSPPLPSPALAQTQAPNPA